MKEKKGMEEKGKRRKKKKEELNIKEVSILVNHIDRVSQDKKSYQVRLRKGKSQ